MLWEHTRNAVTLHSASELRFDAVERGRWAARHPECPAAVSIDGHRGGLTAPANYPGMEPARVDAELAKLRPVFEAQQTPFLATVFEAFLMDDTIDAFAKAQCPTLVLLATSNIEQARDFDELMAAGRRGVERDLTAAAAANPNLTITKVDGTHGMVAAQPAAIADIVRQFLPPTPTNASRRSGVCTGRCPTPPRSTPTPRSRPPTPTSPHASTASPPSSPLRVDDD